MIRRLLPLLLGLLATFASPDARANVPGGIEIVCEANRSSFRSAAQTQSNVTFRLWDAEAGGSQLGTDYVVPMSELVVEKVKAESNYDNVKRRPYQRIEATIGDEGNPVVLGTGEVWLDITIGTTTLSCDEGKRVAIPPVAPPSRRRIQAVAFARTCETCPAPSARSYVQVIMPDAVSQSLPYNTDTRIDFSNELRDDLGEWDTATREFTAQSAGLYLVQLMGLFENVEIGSSYFVRIDSNNDGTTTKATFHAMPSDNGSQPAASVSAHATAVLRLDAGEKIWASADHNDNSTPASLYWREYDTYLYITRLD